MAFSEQAFEKSFIRKTDRHKHTQKKGGGGREVGMYNYYSFPMLLFNEQLLSRRERNNLRNRLDDIS